MRSAWIEICQIAPASKVGVGRAPCGARGLKLVWHSSLCMGTVSRSMRSAWIEIVAKAGAHLKSWSRSMRSAWIEMDPAGLAGSTPSVALHAERVD